MVIPMRFVLLCLLLFAAASARAGEAEFVRIWPAWRDAESFERISEYFSGHENSSGQIVLRTAPETRAGFYFFARVKSTAPLAAARFELTVIRPDSPDPQTFSFPTALPAKEALFQLGLTGAAWPGGKKAAPVAWRLALLAGDGHLLAEQKSFLWEKPAK